jgi:glycosyltransferase involved in cell wall biosynthesis
MKEIAGNAALLVNPESAEEISGAISRILRNQETEEGLKIKGLKRVGEFSWEKTALQTLEAYHSLLA